MYKNTEQWSDARLASATMAYSATAMTVTGENASFADKTITAAASLISLTLNNWIFNEFRYNISDK